MSKMGAFVGRLLLASLFLMSGALKLSAYNPKGPNPVVSYMTPKVDECLGKLHALTGHEIKLEKVHFLHFGGSGGDCRSRTPCMAL
jgi:hypothetical protein